MSDRMLDLADTLHESGIRAAFGVTGSGPSLSLIEALEKRGIRYYPTHTESAAAIMAGAMSRHGRTKALSISIKGPGLVSMLPGIALNAWEHRPALSMSEAYAPEVSQSQRHKRADHEALLSPVVKAYNYGDTNPESVRQLLDVASAEAPGPVHIDFWKDSVDHTPATTDVRHTYASSLNAIRTAIEKSERPVVILGSVVSRRCPSIDWTALSVPVLSTASAKGALDEYSPYAGGVITGEVKELSPESTILAHADLVIAFGLRSTEMVRTNPFSVATYILDSVETSHDGFNAIVSLSSDLKADIDEVVSVLKTKSWGAEEIAGAREHIDTELFSNEWLPASVFRILNEALNAVLVSDTGSFCTIAETVWKARTPAHFLGSSNARFMGTAIPSAIGTAIDDPSVPVVCVFGDGGVGPHFSEIRTAVEHSLPVAFVFLTDGRYGSVAPHTESPAAHAYTFKHSWHAAAQILGCDARTIGSKEEFRTALQTWNRTSPVFFELEFDPVAYHDMATRLR